MSETTVGCERPDGTLNIHAAADTCEVCAVREIRETASQFDTWWRDHGALERLDQSHREAARAAFDAGRASRHTGDCRRWRLVTGHRRVYQGSHACTCGASNQSEEPPT